MAVQQGTQVTLTIPDGAPPGTLLAVPVMGGKQKIKVRVPEGLGAGSTLIIQQMESGEDWDVVVGDVIPHGQEAFGSGNAEEAYQRQQAELEKAWLEQQREAQSGSPTSDVAAAAAAEAQRARDRAREAEEARAALAQREASAAAHRAALAARESAAAEARDRELQQQRAVEEQQRALAQQQERERLEMVAREKQAAQEAIEYLSFNGENLPLVSENHLRSMSFPDLHQHAHYLYGRFGHEQIGMAPPSENDNVIAWIMQVQQNLIEPMRAQNGGPEQPLENAMEAYTVRLDTSVGVIDIIVRPDWAPQGTRRFLELAAAGDLNELAFYRAIKGCIVQFGLPAKRQWPPIPDDPPTGVPFLLGAVSFAAVGENSRKSTLFICIGDMSHCLGQNSWETPIGAVTESSLDVLDRIETCYGDIAEFSGAGPDTTRINAEGGAYLRRDFPRLTYIHSASPLDWQPEMSAVQQEQELSPQASQADQAAFASQAAQAAQAAAQAAQAAKQAAQAAMAAQAAQAAEASRAACATPSGAMLAGRAILTDGVPWNGPPLMQQVSTAPYSQQDVIDVPVEIIQRNQQQVMSMPMAAANANRTNSVAAIMASGQAKDMVVQRYPSLVPATPQQQPGTGALATQPRPAQVQPVQIPMSPQPVQQGLRPPQALLPPQQVVAQVPAQMPQTGPRLGMPQMVPATVGMIQRQQVAGSSLTFPTGNSTFGAPVAQVMPVGQPQTFVQSPVMAISQMPTVMSL